MAASRKKEPGQLSVMDQFDRMKEKHPDALLLFRTGNTYETYRQDAKNSSEILGIPITSRTLDKGGDIKVASFPHEALDTYLPRLVRAGMRVAICEQLEDPKQKKKEQEAKLGETTSQQPINKESDMPRKKKEKTPQEEPVKTTKGAVDETTPKEKKSESQYATQGEAAERKPREPQMVTVNGDKVTHGHAYQSKTNPEDWYFTAKINGEQLKPQKMDPADLVAYKEKELTVPQLMERYYPTKLMPRVPDVAYQVANVLPGPEGNLTIDKFNVYKETDETRADYGKF